QAGAPQAHFPKAAQAGARRELVLLGGGEVIEAQANAAGIVLELDQQAAAPAHFDPAVMDDTLDLAAVAVTQLGDGGDPGTVFVAQGQVEQQVLYRGYAELFQFACQARSDPFEVGDGQSFQSHYCQPVLRFEELVSG